MSARAEPVVVVAYDPAWPAQFETVRETLRAVLGPDPVIEHIGSTSVPGLAAKPILDVMIGVAALEEVEVKIPELEQRGYEYVPEFEADMPERRYLRKQGPGGEGVHLHAVVEGEAFWQRHLAFRDHLRAHPAVAREYERLKFELARVHGSDRVAYTDAKGPFIRRVEAVALGGRR